MIIPMSKVRILGPKESLSDALPVVQSFGMLHVVRPKETGSVSLVLPDRAQEREQRRLERIRRVVSAALDLLGRPSGRGATGEEGLPDRRVLAGWARRARAALRTARTLVERRRELEEERAFLARYRELFGSFEALAASAAQWPGAAVYHVVLPKGGRRALGRLKEGLREILGEEFDVRSRELDSGETGVLILAPGASEERLDALFRAARVEEVELPGRAKGLTPAESVRRIVARYDDIPGEVREVEARLQAESARHAEPLAAAEAALTDALARLAMTEYAGSTRHAFVVEGWVPSGEVDRFAATVRSALGETTIVEEIDREEWVGDDVPVVLKNPRLFRPFETLVGLLPLPRYGSMDPTPFLAVFFPMFFGLVLGDVGYGAVLGILALVLRIRSEPDSTLRSVAEIAGACAAFAVIFGFLYGELFGDAGARLFGLHALAFEREEALLPFLGLALAIGVVHMLLGLVLNLITKARQGGRAMIGPGVMLLMVILVILAILAAADVLPRDFFTPAVLLVLVLFPVLVITEGILGPTELLSTLGHILSYARVMAVGTASVMMAVAANRMIGSMGSVVVGSLFALLFHLVNFVLGVFSPTVHALRLHFVEFFGTFYSPGGMRYEPFRRWSAPGVSESTDSASGEE